MTSEESQRLDSLIRKAAEREAQRWPEVVEAEDVAQDLWMFVLESASVQKYLEEHSDGECVNALIRKARAICSDQRMQYDYFSGNYYYDTAEVRGIYARSKDKSFTSYEEMFDFAVGTATLKSFHPEKYENFLRYRDESGLSGVERERLSQAYKTLTDLMNQKRSALNRERIEGPGTKPSAPKNAEEE